MRLAPRSLSAGWLMLAAFATFPLGPAAAQQGAPWPGLDGYIGSAMKAWNVPGRALVVVRARSSPTRSTWPSGSGRS